MIILPVLCVCYMHNQQGLPTLRHLVTNCSAVSAIHHLPDVLELMRVFSDKFHSRINRDQASRQQIGDFIAKNKSEALNIGDLVDSFMTAWNTMAANQRKRAS